MAKLAVFDAADYLDDEVTIAEYLTTALGIKLSATPARLDPWRSSAEGLRVARGPRR
jgi:hypothetical protein